MAKRKVVREYPGDWPAWKEGEFLAQVKQRQNIPFHVPGKFKQFNKRGLCWIRVTWKWEA